MVYIDSLILGGLSGSLYFLILFELSLAAVGDLKVSMTLSSIFILQVAVGRMLGSVCTASMKTSFLVKYGMFLTALLGLVVVLCSSIFRAFPSVFLISALGICWGTMSSIGKIANRLEGSLSDKFDIRLFSVNSVVGWGVGVVVSSLFYFKIGLIVVIIMWLFNRYWIRNTPRLIELANEPSVGDWRIILCQLKDLRFIIFIFFTSFIVSFFNSSIVPLATINLDFDRESLGLLFVSIACSSLILLIVPAASFVRPKIYESWMLWVGVACVLSILIFFINHPGVFVGTSIAFGLTSTILIQHQVKSASDFPSKSSVKARHTLIEVLSIPATLVVYLIMHL